MNVENVHSSGHSPVSRITTHIVCILSSTVCILLLLHSSAGTLSAPVALRLAVWRITQATSERSGGLKALAPNILVKLFFLHGARLYDTFPTCLHFVQLQSNFRQSLTGYIADVAAAFKSLIWLSGRAAFNFYFEFTASKSMHMPSSCCCLFTVEFSLYLSIQFLISVQVFASLIFLIAAKVPSDSHFFLFCYLMHPIVTLAIFSRTVLVPFQRSSGVTSSCVASNAVKLVVTSAANPTAFSCLSSSRFRGGMLCCLCPLAAWLSALPGATDDLCHSLLLDMCSNSSWTF